MVLFLSLVFAVGSTMLGEVWSGIAESFRIGYGHIFDPVTSSFDGNNLGVVLKPVQDRPR